MKEPSRVRDMIERGRRWSHDHEMERVLRYKAPRSSKGKVAKQSAAAGSESNEQR